MKLILAEADRVRFGCAEVLPWDTGLSIDEAIEIQDRTGIAWTKWPDEIRAYNPRALKAAVWLCLNRAGHQIGWDDVKFDVLALDVRSDESPGKDPESTPPQTSEPSETA
jgi:hypothetical protein